MICGFKSLSLIDYPGQIAPVVFVGGCNFRCPFCHNADLVLHPSPTKEFSEENVLMRIESAKSLADGVVITGGEPTLWGGLESFIRRIRKLGLKVKLDTNGSLPPVLEHLIEEGLLDYIAMDIKTSIARYSEAAGVSVDVSAILKSVSIIKNAHVPHEFRTTCVPGLVEEDDIHAICQMLGQNEKLTLQYFQPDHTIDQSYSQVKPYPPEVMERLLSIITIHGLAGKVI
ncbi:MAG: anaerobic ribonucleoside-triphosphate reductase activating protein [Dehalococcoidales bacterium]|jgi:pyruvate formate lyase activating enzyme|nr:anaerobic ribonucleoside-triphosphate reductase activating protein [Dehalococcoidales bacterium]MDD3264326.1 anaerobic ribonucleoside-triphosphate reductase activating protein [Dehalococcoidales bacterium]MDD4322053.1 anaerobic ribonucleoside-triphosphate reductase activating protein [Dehalococcoidales bacterium]MDD4793624.1 anaerobic ribonucleoside-triphosphate reductase activating protein [Dehalococcoidales bacterium]MDD5497893.1 anaerobic ribonucleoside-triphosphate reductase activating p